MPRPLTDERSKALWKIGFFSRADFIVVALVVGAAVTIFFWKIFGSPTFAQVAVCLLCVNLLVMLWVAALVFRCAWFVIQLTADVKTMPDAAAKMVIAWSRGGTPSGHE